MAARRWRVFPGPAEARISELEMASSPGGSNLCTGGAVLKSSETTGYEATKAFNGDKGGTDAWAPAYWDYPPNNWLGYEFAAAQDIVEVRVWTSSAGVLPTQLHVQYSEDNGTTWHTAAWHWQTFNYSSNYTFAVPDSGDRIYVMRFVGSANTYMARLPLYVPTWPATAFGRSQFPVFNDKTGDQYVATARFIAWGGANHIAGSVVAGSVGVVRRVILIHETTQHTCGCKMSAPDGSFRFDWLASGKYTAMAVDPAGAQNTLIFSGVLSVT